MRFVFVVLLGVVFVFVGFVVLMCDVSTLCWCVGLLFTVCSGSCGVVFGLVWFTSFVLVCLECVGLLFGVDV